MWIWDKQKEDSYNDIPSALPTSPVSEFQVLVFALPTIPLARWNKPPALCVGVTESSSHWSCLTDTSQTSSSELLLGLRPITFRNFIWWKCSLPQPTVAGKHSQHKQGKKRQASRRKHKHDALGMYNHFQYRVFHSRAEIFLESSSVS